MPGHPIHRLARGAAATIVAFTISASVGITAAWAFNWPPSHCFGSYRAIESWKRSQAFDYAQPAKMEGYSFGGGCYLLNNKDDTGLEGPADMGEGDDCSGFVFKVWALRADGNPGYRSWDHEYFIHGPYSTADYYLPASEEPFKTIQKGYLATDYMDAFVWRGSDSGHVALINKEGSDGSDWIIHAHSDSDGTEVGYLDYRSMSITKGVMRKNWTPECYPKCPMR